MKAPLHLSLVLFVVAILCPGQDAQVQVAKAVPAKSAGQDAAASDDSPVPLPELSHFERLWKNSMFTTKALPMPEVPAGPNFADNYTLSGTFEEKGKMTAILIDKTTSGIVQAYIGEDNDAGFRISKIEQGESPDKMRIQIQKGNQAGWVSFGDASAAAPPTDAGSPMNGVPGAINSGPLATRPGSRIPRALPLQPTPQVPQPQQTIPNVPRALPVPSAPQMPATNQTPNLQGGAPQVPPSLPGDPPLPPP